MEQRQFDASDDANFVNVLDTTHVLRINSRGGSDTISATDAAGLVTLDTGAGRRAAHRLFDRSDDVHALDPRAGAMLRIGPDAVLLKTSGALALDGTLDLAGGAMLFRGDANVPSPVTLRAKLSAGRNGGAWNGTGPIGAVHSSLAAASPMRDGVGYGLDFQVAPTATIGPFSVGPDDTIVRYALEGDANLDGRVNLADFNRLAANFGVFNRGWVNGDLNYDAAVNLADFNTLAGNFGGAAAPHALGRDTEAPAKDLSLLRDLLR